MREGGREGGREGRGEGHKGVIYKYVYPLSNVHEKTSAVSTSVEKGERERERE